jgi:Stigma-specific protein, Stig1
MLSIRSSALSFIVVLGFVAACDDDAPSCPAELCGGSCVSTESDPKHCGGCDMACATGAACESGACVAVCQIDGKQVSAGAVNAANACEQCAPATSATAWTQRADGTSCNPGQVCSAGVCTPKCFIDGVVYVAGAPNPANACETCVPATSTTQWTPRASVPLLVGGDDITAQGWTTVAQTPNTLTYGADYVRLATSTNGGGSMSGQLLITRANSLDGTKPFKLHVTMQVESVNTHNPFDSGAAIMGSFTPPFGSGADRPQMIYLDSAAIGWADDTQSAAFSVTDGAYHVYELAVDAAKVATVSIDGVAKLTRNNFTTNGTIALGDQTNEVNVDGAVRIKSVERLCP